MRKKGEKQIPGKESAQLPPESEEFSSDQAQRPRSRWWISGTLVATILLGLGIGHITALVARPLALIVLGITVAAALSPIVEWLAGKMPRGLAIFLVYLSLVLVAAGAGLVITPLLVDQTRQVIEQAPETWENFRERLGSVEWLSRVNIFDVASSQAENVGRVLLALPVAIFSSFVDIGVVLFVSIYWLITSPALERFLLSLYPPGKRRRVERLVHGMGRAMGGYVRGSVIDGAAVGVISYIGYLIIGVNYPLVLALLAAILELVPTLGPLIAGAITILVALLQSPTKALIVLVFVIGVQQLENHVLVPNIMQTQADISPLLVIIALLIGGTLGGLLGVFVAIPIAAALNVVVGQVAAPAIRRSTGALPPGHGDTGE